MYTPSLPGPSSLQPRFQLQEGLSKAKVLQATLLPTLLFFKGNVYRKLKPLGSGSSWNKRP